MEAGIPQFYIPATSSLQERRPRTLKHGDNFAIFDHYGDIVGGPENPEGLYHRDTRHLSMWRLSVAGLRPMLLSSTVQNDNALFNVDLTNPDIYQAGRIAVARDTLHIMRRKFLWQQACHETIALRNYARQPHSIVLAFDFDADFADIFEVRGQRRERRGSVSTEVRGRDAVVFTYRGLDGIERQTEIAFQPEPHTLSANGASFEFSLAPGQRTVVHADLRCRGERTGSAERVRLLRRMRDARRARVLASARAAAVDTSHSMVNEVICRGFADIVMLVSDTDQGPYPYAGIPWYCTPFGRDGILTALQMLWLDPELARGALRFLAANQARESDITTCAQPGKIIHEMRHSEMARLREVPFGRYYGTVDATPLFVVLAGMYNRRTRDIATLRELWPSLRAALEWIDRYGDRDGDGFVEYTPDPNGLANQGWRDSGDAVFHSDGSLAQHTWTCGACRSFFAVSTATPSAVPPNTRLPAYPQAWASAAPFGLIAAALGIDFDSAAGHVRFRHPRLPEPIEHVRIRNLRIGSGTIDVLLRRYGRDVAVNVLEKSGPVNVEVLL